MPIRIEDPFRDPTTNLRDEVNPFVAKLKTGSASGTLPTLYGPYLKSVKGAWRERFQKTAGITPSSLVLEIGSHKGDVLSAMAKNHPDLGFIGMDITFKRVVTLAQRAVQDSLPNVLSVLCNAQAIDQLFAPQELDGVVIFFPDPWANKKRQQKNRLLNESFLKRIHRALKPGGFFWFKTDHAAYFEEVSETAGELFAETQSPSGIISEVYTSKFEKQFRELGLPTFEVCWSK